MLNDLTHNINGNLHNSAKIKIIIDLSGLSIGRKLSKFFSGKRANSRLMVILYGIFKVSNQKILKTGVILVSQRAALRAAGQATSGKFIHKTTW